MSEDLVPTPTWGSARGKTACTWSTMDQGRSRVDSGHVDGKQRFSVERGLGSARIAWRGSRGGEQASGAGKFENRCKKRPNLAGEQRCLGG